MPTRITIDGLPTERTPTSAELDLVHQILSEVILNHENAYVRQRAAQVLANEMPNNGLDTLRDIFYAELGSNPDGMLETSTSRVARILDTLGINHRALHRYLTDQGFRPPITCSNCGDVSNFRMDAPVYTCSYCRPN